MFNNIVLKFCSMLGVVWYFSIIVEHIIFSKPNESRWLLFSLFLPLSNSIYYMPFSKIFSCSRYHLKWIRKMQFSLFFEWWREQGEGFYACLHGVITEVSDVKYLGRHSQNMLKCLFPSVFPGKNVIFLLIKNREYSWPLTNMGVRGANLHSWKSCITT